MTADELQRAFEDYLTTQGVTLTDGQRGIARALLEEAADHENVRAVFAGAGGGKTFVMRTLEDFFTALSHQGRRGEA